METLLQILIALVLGAHLLAMNVASSGPLVAVCLRWVRPPQRELAMELGYRLARYSVMAMLAGLPLGGVALLLTLPAAQGALERFPARAYWFALAELLFSLACMAIIWLRWNRWPSWLHAFVALLTVSNMLYHFPPLMAVIGETAANAAWSAEATFDRPAVLTLMKRGEVLSLWLHFVLASAATSAIAGLWLLAKRQDANAAANDDAKPSPEGQQNLEKRLARWALWPTLLQLPVGGWIVASVGGPARDALMGGDLLASATLLGGVVAALMLMQNLAYAALGATEEHGYRKTVALLITVVLLMTITLRAARMSEPATQVLTVQIAASMPVN